MELNSFVFPSPPPSYTMEDRKENLIFVPRAPVDKRGKSMFGMPLESAKDCTHIPCLLLNNQTETRTLLLFFHGNAEDIGIAEDILGLLIKHLNAHAIAIEYPGYGIYPGHPSAPRIVQDGINVFDYVCDILNWSKENIIIIGRSIGSGPATQLAALKHSSALLLISPFTSIKGVVRGAGYKFISYFVQERFRNKEIIKSVKCPICIVHGKKDRLINCAQSNELQSEAGGPTEVINPPDMDHNDFEIIKDICKPLKDFCIKNKLISSVASKYSSSLSIFESLLHKPPNFPKPTQPGLFMRIFKKLF